MTAQQSRRIGAAVDLGSTTIAIRCIDLITGERIMETSFANPQCRYGADVITRIQHCLQAEEMAVRLRNIVWSALLEQLQQALQGDMPQLKRIVISGNTTMQHILRGLSVEGLAKAPFHPVDLNEAEEIQTWNDQKIAVHYLPGLSAFVGADILSGAAYLQMGTEQTYDLLVDLGTNGELLLLNNEQGYASSTACGPVFDHVISGAAYGSESIHAIANCVKRHLIDRSGLIAAPFFEKGIMIDRNFVIRQQNVRNFQLAKGAIYAGICCLVEEAAIDWQEIRNVYISGGMGFYMDIKDAFVVGLLPQELKGTITISGNSSLEGATKFLQDEENMRETCSAIRKRTNCLELANLPQFQTRYLEAMNF